MKYYLDLKDKRLQEIEKLFADKNLEVKDFESNIDEISNKDICVVSPSYKWKKDIISRLKENTQVFAGNISDDLKQYSSKLSYINIMEDEEFVVNNAKLTAECFLVDLLSNTKLSVFEQNILILGSGKVAKALEYLLYKMGVSFSCAMRNEKEYHLSKLLATNSYLWENFKERLKDFDIIINTVPVQIFTENDKNYFKKGSFVFELASVKCLDESKFDNIKYCFCPALPSKYSPFSAGKLIFDKVFK